MKSSGKSSPKIQKKTILSPEKPSLLPPFLESLANPKNPHVRLAMALGLLALGGYLIETHPTLNLCVLGILLWGGALFQALYWFPQVPGVQVFSGSPLRSLKGSGEWNWREIALAGAGLWLLVGFSNHFIQWGHWSALLVSLLLVGWFFSFLERHSPAFWPEQSKPLSAPSREFPWAALLILAVGSFFLFYGWDIFPIGHDNDAGYNMEICNSYLLPNGRTTPYTDGWSWGNPSLPFFLVGLFFKLFGSSLARGTLFIALCNLAGYLFFYGFLRFYLSKTPALVAALLFSSCYWVIYWAREVSAVGLLLPFECATLYFFARTIEKGKAADFAIFGTLCACLFMVAVHGRVLVALLFLSLLLLWLFRRGEMSGQKKSWVLATGAAFLWYLPMLLYYQHSSHPFLGAEEFVRDSAWGGGRFSIPWANLQKGLQMFNLKSSDTMGGYFPRLSPWEGLLLLAGFGWCLWRLYNPVVLFILLGFFLGLAPSVLSNNPTLASRAIAVAPFVYLLVGIGLDRLGRVVAAPLGSTGGALRFLFPVLFLALSLGWQYDVFFHQLPRNKTSYSADASDRGCEKYLLGKTITQYVRGWTTCVETCWWQDNSPDGGFDYTFPDVISTEWERTAFWPAASPLPLKNMPANPYGVALLFSDQGGKAFQDWIQFYYPDAKSRIILNPFCDVKIRLWEISAGQIQKAPTLHPGPPPGGLLLSWYDSKNHRLGQWRIPTLSSMVIHNDYLRGGPGNKPFPWDKVAYFTAQGSLDNTDGRPLALETNGKVEGVVNGRKFHWAATADWSRFEIPPAPKGWVSIELRYVPPSLGDFGLSLSRRDPAGWDLIPSSNWKPGFNHERD